MITWRVGFWYYTDLRHEEEVDAFTYEQALSGAFMQSANVLHGDWPREKGFRITVQAI
jgi:hypothetical protein